ncbi:MAG TPA: hypothetical protein VL494_25830, partial [Steroidobacteraceae bacterium]|nr:hypothetical protein [Steroidobacteraceae bacterium]
MLASAEAFIDARDVAQARGRLAEAVQLDLDDARVDVVAQRLEELVARVEDQRRKEALNRQVAEVVEQALQRFDRNPQEAVAFLERSDVTTHPRVAATLAELREKLAEIEERTRRERERQAEEARRAAARAEAERLHERQRLAAERKRHEDEAREREQKRIAAERQRLEDEARERDRQRAIEEQQLRGRKARQREAREREEDQQATIVRPAKEAATVPAKAPGQIVPPTPAPKSKMLVAAATLVVVLIGAGVALYVTHVDQRGRQEPEQAPQSGQSGPTGDQKSRDEKSLDPVAPRDNPTPVPQPRPDDVNPQVQRQAEIAATRTVIDGAMAKDDLDRADRLLADAQRRFDADTFSAQSRELARLRAIKSAQSAIERQAAADKAAADKAAADRAAADRAAADRAAADKAAADRAAA